MGSAGIYDQDRTIVVIFRGPLATAPEFSLQPHYSSALSSARPSFRQRSPIENIQFRDAFGNFDNEDFVALGQTWKIQADFGNGQAQVAVKYL